LVLFNYTISGVTISPIDEISYSIFAPNKDALGEAKQMIEKLLGEMKEPELEFGGIYTGKIVELRSNGILIQLYPTMPPVLLPNSQLDRRKVLRKLCRKRFYFEFLD
jgi:hypothetical protein